MKSRIFFIGALLALNLLVIVACQKGFRGANSLSSGTPALQTPRCAENTTASPSQAGQPHEGYPAWTVLSDFQCDGGYDSYPSGLKILSDGVMVVAGEGRDGATDHWLIRRSEDGGASWATVTDFQLEGGRQARSAVGHFFDLAPNELLTLGWATSASGLHSIVKKSADRGRTWNVLDNFNYPGGMSGTLNLKVDSAGNFYRIGTVTISPGIFRGLVRKSTDRGLTWSTASDFQVLATSTNIIHAKILGSGAILAAIQTYGPATNLSGVPLRKWILAKSVDGGITWAVKDEFSHVNGKDSAPWTIAEAPNGDLFVTGMAYGAANEAHGIIRRSTDGGETWTTVDAFIHLSTANGYFFTPQFDSAGNIYVSGWGDGASENYWFLRKSTDGGATWATQNAFQTSGLSLSAGLRHFTIGLDDKMYVIGTDIDVDGSLFWVMRASQDGGATWVTLDDYQLVDGQDSFPFQITIGATGDIFVLGFAKDVAGHMHWIIKKRSAW